MDDNHTTKEPLASMSLDDLRAEMARQEAIFNAVRTNIETCKLAIIDKIAYFSIGDRVTDRKGVRWEIDFRELRDWDFKEPHDFGFAEKHIRYFGKRIKKDGTPGMVSSEIFYQPIRLTLSEENAI